MNNNRHIEIDLLRGIAILAMILIHTTYYFLSDPIALALWNYSQFAVPVFVFCSAFIFFNKSYNFSLLYVFKRIKRLLIPYYVFAIFFISLVYFFEPKKVTTTYLLKNILVIGGIDINWLVLLFIQFAIVFPLISYLFKKQELIFYAYCFLSILSLIYFVFQHTPIDYKLVMWLPWSTIALYTWYVVKNENKKWFYKITIPFSFGAFLVLYFIQRMLSHPLYLQQNKYPPNLYFLSFGIFSITLLLYFAKYFFPKNFIRSFFIFLSKYSYSIYFIHYCILYLCVKTILHSYSFSWLSFFLAVLIPTIVIQYAYAYRRYNNYS